MTPELRSALAELSFAYAEAQSEAARYERERSAATANALSRRLHRVSTQSGVVMQAISADVRAEYGVSPDAGAAS